MLPSKDAWLLKLLVERHELEPRDASALFLKGSTGKVLERALVGKGLSVREVADGREIVDRADEDPTRAGFVNRAFVRALCFEKGLSPHESASVLAEVDEKLRSGIFFLIR